jgi:hypothetical protein
MPISCCRSLRVSNQIAFADWLVLRASAPAKVDSPTRLSYAFDSLSLTILGLTLLLPFVRGGGWTQAVSAGSEAGQRWRIMQNSQGDTLVFVYLDWSSCTWTDDDLR